MTFGIQIPLMGKANENCEPKMTLEEAYKQGFRDGIYCYSWMKDGVSYVGTMGKTLKSAYSEIDMKTHYNYNPPKENENG